MPPAAPRTCEFPDCSSGPPDGDGLPTPYTTRSDNNTRAELMEDLNSHMRMRHELPAQSNSTALLAEQNRRIKAETAKILAEKYNNQDRDRTEERRFHQKSDSIPRPSIQEGSSDSDWSFFEAQWKCYTMGSNMTAAEEIQQLWAACTQSLQRQLHNGGGTRAKTPTQLLSSIKFLAVKRHNNIVNIVEFQRMGQLSEETVNAFSTRLNGHADICDLFVSCHECQADVSYKDQFIMHQFIRGLRNIGAQGRIMETAAQSEGGQLTMIQTLKIAEAYEIGKQSQELVNHGGQLSKLSQHQRNKNKTRQNNRQQDKDKTKPLCSHCGRSDHTSKLQDRRDNCPAFDKSCNKCKTNGNFGPQCRGGPRSTRDKSTTRDKPSKDNPKVNEVKSQDKEKDKESDKADLGTLSSSWFLMNGTQGSQSKCAIYEDSQEFSSVLRRPRANIASISSKDTLKKLRHHIKDEFGNWKPAHVQPHGNIQVSLQVSQSAAEQLQLQPIQHAQQTVVRALADTGAQMCVAYWSVAKKMGLSKRISWFPLYLCQ